ncbi:hypothetical protein KGM_202440 [Danaus plexippus plexippus]|uniref:Uncharacterized protein n=1 Tax=Danaus plexippus plexippus TaxID=278856 RepID=A0A212FL68_DANPL|nr:hypothetical protein KGM_202440 [Danaus plexippus plexippus]
MPASSPAGVERRRPGEAWHAELSPLPREQRTDDRLGLRLSPGVRHVGLEPTWDPNNAI